MHINYMQARSTAQRTRLWEWRCCLPGSGRRAGPGTQPDRTITRHVLHKCNMHTTYTWARRGEGGGEAECKGTCVGSLDRIWFWFGIGLQVQLTTCRRQSQESVCVCVYIYMYVCVCVCERLLELVECRLSGRR